MQNINFLPLYLSLNLAFISTIILFIISMPLSWFISNLKNYNIKTIIESIITLPLVLPPTILGFYLLIIFNQDNIIGKTWFILTGSTLAFSFSGLVIASCLYSLPFMIQPIQTSFEKIGKNPIEKSFILQQSKINIFIKIILPLSKRGIIRGLIISFTHTLGEFGVVLMVGGNIPGKTQVISIAIYELVEQLNYTSTHLLSGMMLILSFVMLVILFKINNKKNELY